MRLTIQYFHNIFENDNGIYYNSMGLGVKILNKFRKHVRIPRLLI